MNNLMNKLLELDRKKLILVVLAFIMFIYVDFAFLIGKQWQNIQTLQPKIAKLTKDIDTLTKDLERVKLLKNKQVETNQKIISKAKKSISEAEIISLLKSVSALAKKDGVQIIQIRSSKDAQFGQEKIAPTDKFIPIYIILDLITDYHRLGNFMNNLEDSQTFIAVQSFKIDSNQTDYMKQSINLVLKTYVTK